MPEFKIKAPVNTTLTEQEVNARLSYFKSYDYRKAPNQNFGNMLVETLMSFGTGSTYLTCTEYHELKRGSLLYRTRAFEKANISSIKLPRDFYSPPKELTKWGRVNRPYNPLLYASFTPNTAIKENYEIKKGFLLITYRLKSSIKLRVLGKLMNSKSIDGTTKQHVLFNHVNNFVENLMLHKINEEHYYIFTNDIIENVFIGDKSNGYYYPSAAHANQFNVAINPIHENTSITIAEVWYCKRTIYGYKKISRLL